MLRQAARVRRLKREEMVVSRVCWDRVVWVGEGRLGMEGGVPWERVRRGSRRV